MQGAGPRHKTIKISSKNSASGELSEKVKRMEMKKRLTALSYGYECSRNMSSDLKDSSFYLYGILKLAGKGEEPSISLCAKLIDYLTTKEMTEIQWKDFVEGAENLSNSEARAQAVFSFGQTLKEVTRNLIPPENYWSCFFHSSRCTLRLQSFSSEVGSL